MSVAGQLVAAGIHGVTADYVREISRSGHNLGTVDALVRRRIQSHAGAGDRRSARPSAEELVSLRMNGGL